MLETVPSANSIVSISWWINISPNEWSSSPCPWFCNISSRLISSSFFTIVLLTDEFNAALKCPSFSSSSSSWVNLCPILPCLWCFFIVKFKYIGFTNSIVGIQISDISSKMIQIDCWVEALPSKGSAIASSTFPWFKNILIMIEMMLGALPVFPLQSVSHLTIIKRSINPNRHINSQNWGKNSKNKSTSLLK